MKELHNHLTLTTLDVDHYKPFQICVSYPFMIHLLLIDIVMTTLDQHALYAARSGRGN